MIRPKRRVNIAGELVEDGGEVMITTEEAEWLARQHDLVRFTLGMKAPEHDLTAATIRSQAAEITRLRAELATARRDGMEQAAQRLEELHKNHGYNSRTGKTHHCGKLVECSLTVEHSIGYYRAITEGSAHIRAATGEGKP